MIYVNVILTVKGEFASEIDDISNLLSQQCQLSRQEPGCKRFEVYHSQSDPLVFILCERWESQEALDVHRQAKGFTEIYQPRILPRVERVPHISKLVE